MSLLHDYHIEWFCLNIFSHHLSSTWPSEFRSELQFHRNLSLQHFQNWYFSWDTSSLILEEILQFYFNLLTIFPWSFHISSFVWPFVLRTLPQISLFVLYSLVDEGPYFSCPFHIIVSVLIVPQLPFKQLLLPFACTVVWKIEAPGF